jgi:L-ascorbate metabolism protein UlaG (beta-lactamase superfamily)
MVLNALSQRESFACLRELDAHTLGLRLPKGLSLTWLGTAGYAFSYQDHTLLIDPYVSRASLADVLLRRRLGSDRQLLEQYVPRASAVLVGHTHFDHAVDVPAIARRDNCKAYGSSSLACLMRVHGLADRAVTVAHGQRYDIGPFEVTFVDSLHAKLALGLAVPNDGEISCEHVGALTANQYRCGAVYSMHIRVAGTSFYHQGSAGLIEERIPAGCRRADYLLMGIAGRRFTPHYTERTIRALDPGVIIPTHHDDFFQPLAKAMSFSFNVRFDRFVDEAARVSRSLTLRTLAPLCPLVG